MITQEELQSQLNYDPETGIFTRLVSNSPGVKVGSVAGTINSSTGYVRIQIFGNRYQAHRLAWLYMYGEFPSKQMDHLDHNRINNVISNLRCASNQENLKNQTKRRNNTSGVTGVSWFKPTEKWRAQVTVNGKNKHLGCFIDKEEAIRVRNEANITHNFHPNHGE